MENISSNKAWAKQEKVTDNKQDLADISEETDCLIIKNSDKKINLIGPIQVRATGPKIISIVDKFDPIDPIEMKIVITENKNRKREQQKGLSNQLEKFYSPTTKRASLHFDPEVFEEPSLKFHSIAKNTEKLSPLSLDNSSTC